jgi:uncharacterized protein (TIGR00255 family)
MIRSMTGYCKTDVSFEGLTCDVEIRSVNSRHLDIRLNMPHQFVYLDEKLKKLIRKRIGRGKLDVQLHPEQTHEESEKLTLNESLWQQLMAIAGKVEIQTDKPLALQLSDLFGIKGLLTFEQNEIDHTDYEGLLSKAVDKGIDELLKMREREGELLLKEISQYSDELRQMIQLIPQYREEVIEKYRQKITKNFKSLELKYDQNDPRLMQELGIFLDRMDNSEEIDRFNAHLTQLADLMDKNEPAGRKLEFILQELNREANTICAKSNHTQITQTGIEIKNIIEKLREQAQNIE